MEGGIKGVVFGFLAALAAYIQPINGAMFALFYVLALNFTTGVIVGLRFKGEEFEFKKAFKCISESAAIMCLIASIYIVGERNGNAEECLILTSYAVYVACIAYGQNIVRNLRTAFPNNKFIELAYYILSAEWLKINLKHKNKEVKDEEI